MANHKLMMQFSLPGQSSAAGIKAESHESKGVLSFTDHING